MENQTGATGPRATGGAPDLPSLSSQRAQVLQSLRRAGPLTVTALARALDLHPNTVRDHVAGLLEAGLVCRERQSAIGRGRPAWQYRARATGGSTSLRNHIELVAALAGHLARTSPRPAEEAAAAGRDWGVALVRDRPQAPTTREARRAVTGLLEGLGFAPAEEAGSDGRLLRLRECPILDSARRHPEIVCAAHAGMVSAALAALGDPQDAAAVRLLPFARPGACVLHLGPARPQDAPGGVGGA